jgi:hypothetical protein
MGVNDMSRDSFYFRLGDNDQDKIVSQWIDDKVASGESAGAAIKALIAADYKHETMVNPLYILRRLDRIEAILSNGVVIGDHTASTGDDDDPALAALDSFTT